MAQKVQVMLVCDLHDDEVEGVETVAFGLDGSSYEVDACEEHAAALRDAFAPYVGAARRAGRAAGGRVAPQRRPRAGRGAAPAAARRQGRSRRSASGRGPTATTVSERGRLSGAVRRGVRGRALAGPHVR